MLVPKSVVAAILNGHVTSARVPLTTFGLEVWLDERAEERQRPLIPTTIPLRSAQDRPEGHNPSLPAPAGKPLCKLRVLDWAVVRLDETTEEDARSEGYVSVDELALAYMDAYGAAWTDSDGILLRFEVLRAEGKRPMLGPWDPGSEMHHMRRAPEPEQVAPGQANGGRAGLTGRQRYHRDRLAQQAAYADRSMHEQLRAIEADREWSEAARDDLKVIRKRLESANRKRAA